MSTFDPDRISGKLCFGRRWLWLLAALLLAACGIASPTPTRPARSATPTRIALDAPLPTRTATSTQTPLFTATATLTLTPFMPGASLTPLPTFDEDEMATPVTAVPTPLDPVPFDQTQGADGVTVILLIGADTANPRDIGRTDALMLVAIHHAAGTVSALSIPRDLFVHIPTLGMARINVAYSHGERRGYPGGGPALLRDTVRYNLGIHAPYYARTDFGGFAALVDALDGVTVSVPCPVEDWILRPGGDVADEGDWSLLTLPVGAHDFDGRLALWYVRSRRESTDLDRGRRQQDVMRAIGRRVQDIGWLEALPATWDEVAALVDTNLTLDVLAGLVPMAVSLEPENIERLAFAPERDYLAWTTPDGQDVLLPVGDGLAQLATWLLTPPTPNQLVLGGATVEVANHSGRPDLARVAADQLLWAGLAATYDDSGGGAERARTAILDYTGRTKDTPLATLQRLLDVADDDVRVLPDPDRTVDFRVELGRDYDSCR